MGDNVILVGFMGAGKSSVGRLLARRLGRCFVETDDMITAQEGRSIPDIFAERGEAHFRALEEETVRLLALKSGDVIATGGACPAATGAPRRSGPWAPWCGSAASSTRCTSGRSARARGRCWPGAGATRSRRFTGRASPTIARPTSRWTPPASIPTRSWPSSCSSSLSRAATLSHPAPPWGRAG